MTQDPSPTVCAATHNGAPRQSGWLIEDVWTRGPGTPLYVHRDFDLGAWNEQVARNRERRGRNVHDVPLATSAANDAKRFDSHGAAIQWLATMPKWLNSGQYQAREHMWPADGAERVHDDTPARAPSDQNP